MSRDLGGVSPPCFSGNRQRENLPQTFPERLGKTWRVLTWANTHRGERLCKFIPPEIPAHHWSKQTERVGEERGREPFSSASPPRWHSRGLSYPVVTSPQRGKDSSVWVPSYPSCAECCRINPVFLSNIQSTEAKPPWLGEEGDWERGREYQRAVSNSC